jgi:hypothetical protein
MRGFAYPQAMWDNRFSKPNGVFGEQPNAFLVSQAAHLGQCRALALVNGERRNSVWLAQQSFPEGPRHSGMPTLVGFVARKI